MKKRTILSLLLASFGVTALAGTACSKELKYKHYDLVSEYNEIVDQTLYAYEDHYYAVLDLEGYGYEAAEIYCENMGGHLVTLTSEDENLYVISLLDQTICADLGQYPGVTIGATKQSNNQFAWVTGEKWKYECFGKGEPNGGSAAPYLNFYNFDSSELNYKWDDGTTHGKYFVCEWDKAEDIGTPKYYVAKTISNATQLSGLSKLSGNSNASGTYVLTSDIDLSGVEWTPIAGFSGTLDGAGHTIKNLSVTGTNGNFGLFDELNNATVNNLTLENVNISVVGTSGDVGSLVGVAKNSTLNNIIVSGTVSAMLMEDVGGLVGYVENTTVTNCKNYANVTGYSDVGGVAGQYARRVKNESDYVEKNENYGEINGTSDKENSRVGGVFGQLWCYPGAYKSGATNWLFTIQLCNNYGKVSSAGHDVGGVVGEYTTSRWSSGATYVDVAFANCTNEGTVTGASFHTGGIVGECGSCRSVMNCENKGNVSASGYDVGGIVGSGTATTVMMCKNSGEITGAAFVGGIMGWTSSIITNCENNGNITATGKRDSCDFLGEEGVTGVGGIAGVTGRYVSKSTNNGHIYSTGGGSCIGGIAGGMVAKNGDIIESNVNNGYMNITGESDMVGGIVGKMHSSRPGSGEGEYTFSGKNTANVTAGESWRVGGIIGYVATQSEWSYQDRTYVIIINSENSGMITGAFRVAGIVGTIWNYARMDSIYWSTNKNTGSIVCDAAEKAELYLMAS